jgi:hypothetical protein
MRLPPFAPYPPSAPGMDEAPGEGGLPMSGGLRILMGIGFLAIGIVQGVTLLTSPEVVGTVAILEGIGFFLLAGTGVTMLMDRSYSLYLLLVWAILGIVTTFLGEVGVAYPALIARILVALVAVAAIGQKGARARMQAGI